MRLVMMLLLNKHWMQLMSFNRDEFYYRPTEPLGWWAGDIILGGRDELGGGTWLGSTRDGTVAFLTNFREVESLLEPKTRGDLTIRFLQSKKSPQEFAEKIVEEAHVYNGFNLVCIDICSFNLGCSERYNECMGQS
ncbi:transport and Golgi organization protein 2 homolog isoform X2 [Arachis ipaensis]|uniref:transport and Golgi organization protein 2 homolog isoform X2 n=1 Tax=Arachis ipaensis TaxID=130454 RepID=UPI0007AF8F8B|nr:transport and Golgi organization protein 2 homolog isoform X2 [Arachis ipaensis]XP_020975038.1 transport and Golgi organization protein 2 homolog isoform X2 [Arachis ipaensis]